MVYIIPSELYCSRYLRRYTRMISFILTFDGYRAIAAVAANPLIRHLRRFPQSNKGILRAYGDDLS